jgi:hypothetical protein
VTLYNTRKLSRRQAWIASGTAVALTCCRELTRRANHLHMFTIAKILQPAPSIGCGLFESSRGRMAILSPDAFAQQSTAERAAALQLANSQRRPC